MLILHHFFFLGMLRLSKAVVTSSGGSLFRRHASKNFGGVSLLARNYTNRWTPNVKSKSLSLWLTRRSFITRQQLKSKSLIISSVMVCKRSTMSLRLSNISCSDSIYVRARASVLFIRKRSLVNWPYTLGIYQYEIDHIDIDAIITTPFDTF